MSKRGAATTAPTLPEQLTLRLPSQRKNRFELNQMLKIFLASRRLFRGDQCLKRECAELASADADRFRALDCVGIVTDAWPVVEQVDRAHGAREREQGRG